MIFFTCVTSSDTTLERPTSEPVPAVVGSATKYGIGRSIGRTCGWSHAYSSTSPGCVGHQRDRLRDVERGAAAQADHRVGAMRLVRRGAAADLARDRVAPDLRVDGDVESREVGDERRQQRQRGDAAVGHDQRPADAGFLEVPGDELARAGAEMDGRGEAEAGDRGRGHGGVRKRIMWVLSWYALPMRVARGSMPNGAEAGPFVERARAGVGRGDRQQQLLQPDCRRGRRRSPAAAAPCRGRGRRARRRRTCRTRSPCAGPSRAPRARGRRCRRARRRRTHPRRCPRRRRRAAPRPRPPASRIPPRSST